MSLLQKADGRRAGQQCHPKNPYGIENAPYVGA
jgi:hypothetical protein